MIIKSNCAEETASRSTPVAPNYNWREVEDQVRKFIQRIGIHKVVRAKYGRRKRVGYVEGPPTLNGVPHIGHIRGRMMKDLWYRFSTLQGKNVAFRAGWDCQGLPVELQAEKELGLTGNKWEDLRKIGEEKLVDACKSLIAKYEVAWVEADNLLGLLIDHSKAYLTYKNEYIEREWKYLERAWNANVLGEGFKVVPYCPSCQTSLSHAEAVLGYETVDDPSLYYKVKTDEGAYLVIWTTMPFTVVTDELVGVNPEADYLYVRRGDETWVVGAERKEALVKELGVEFGETVKTVKGKDLAGVKYKHPLLELVPGLKRLSEQGSIHRVVAEDFVDTSTGTGIVHLSPANGEEDFQVASKLKIPVFSPIDDRVTFTEDAGKFSGLFVRDADAVVSQLLKQSGSFVFEGRLSHEYPTCWRSGHRLVWVARREYFYWIDKIKDDLIAAAESVEYYFDQPKNRFIEFIRQSPPWNISRERVWGTPLPIWACDNCNEKIPAFSREAIVKLAAKLPDGKDFELHRPWIDRVVLRCPKCRSEAHREPFVLDTWHNSGASPYASFTDEEFAELVPVAHLTEGIDQTRGWAYTLLVLSVILNGKPTAPYEAFLFQGLVLDEKGRKMSKSLGNVVDALEMLKEGSVDLLRFYLLWKSSPVDSVSLDVREMSGRPYQILNTLYHLHVYLHQNAPLDGYDPSAHSVSWAEKKGLLSLVERWLLANLHEASSAILNAYEESRYNEACKLLEEAIVETFSQNYVRMVRSELWKDTPEDRERRLAVYATMGFVLETIDILLHPVAPYVTEYLYQQVLSVKETWKEPLILHGVRKTSLPKGAESDRRVVDVALQVESACNSARMKAKLKRRWPLRNLMILAADEKGELVESAKDIISMLCNVKAVSVTKSLSSLPVQLSLTPNRSQVGATFKERTGEILRLLKPKEGQEAWETYRSGVPVKVNVHGGETIEVPLSAFDLSFRGIADWEAAVKGDILVAIEKIRDDSLIAEGIARDLARRLQALRKKRGFSPTAVLDTASVAGLDEETVRLVTPLRKELSFLVRAKVVSIEEEKRRGKANWEEDELDGRTIYLDIS